MAVNVYPVSAETYRRRRIVVGLVFSAFVLILVFGLSRCGGGDDTENLATADPVVEVEPTVAPTSTPAPIPVSGPGPEDIISQIQTDLTALGYYSGPINAIYDEATLAAILSFQETTGIAALGVFGSETAQGIDTALERPGGSTTLQTTLAGLCYYTDEIDGIYGPATEQAIRALQTTAGIDVDGLYGPETAATLTAAWGSRPDSCPETAAEPEDPEPAEDLDAITVVADGVGITFNSNASCVLDADLAGTIDGTADDGTTFSATLGGAEPKVIITGSAGTNEAPITLFSPEETVLTIEAGVPTLVITVARSLCDS